MTQIFGKINKKFFVIIFAILIIGLFFINQARAATITNFEARISDSRPSQAGVIYDFQGNLTDPTVVGPFVVNVKCIKVRFCISKDRTVGCVAPGMDASSAGVYHFYPYTWNVLSSPSWTVHNATNNYFELKNFVDLDGQPGGANSSWVVNGITNPSIAGSYFTWVDTYNNLDCSSSLIDSGETGFVIVPPAEGISVSLIISGATNPIPVLDSINPLSKVRGSSGFEMTLTGSNFISSSVVRFAGSDRTTTFVDSTTLRAQISSSDLETVGDFNITVFNPGPGGGVSNAKVFTVTSSGGGGNPTPILISINPTSKNKDEPGFTMTLTGSDFISSSSVRFNGLVRSTTYLNSNTLQAEILADDLKVAGDFNITVFNPAPGGGESGPKVFKVIDLGLENPIPVLNNISPDSKIVGDETFIMTLTGSNFISSSLVRFAGSDRITNYINSTTLTVQIPAADLLMAGDFNITVFNPGPGGGQSGAKIFTVNNPVPILISINPTWKYQNSSAFIMTLTGSNFISSSIVRFAGSNRATTYINSTTLEVEILAVDLQTIGNFEITVFSPAPGGGQSNAQILRVLRLTDNPIPSLNSINPSWRYQNSGAFTMTLSGSDFIESSLVRFAGDERSTAFINANTLQAYILITDLQTLGDFNITVFNPGPGGGQSGAQVFKVLKLTDNPVPALISINPTWKYQNSGAFTMTLTGSNFISSSVVRFAGFDRLTSYFNATTLTAQISSIDLETVGNFNITVFNPGPGGGESNQLVFNVLLLEEEEEIPAPIITQPANGSFLNNKVVTIKGLAQANKLVDLFINDQKKQTITSNNNGEWQVETELAEGIYYLKVISQNKQSGIVKITIDLTPPQPPKLLEAIVLNQNLLINQISFSLFIRGENSPDTETIRLVTINEFLFSPGGEKWEKIFNLISSAGKYQVYAFAYDLAGNVSLPSNVLEFNVGLEVEPLLNILPPMILLPEIIDEIRKIIIQPEIQRTIEDTSGLVLPLVTALSLGATISAVASSGMTLLQLLPALYFLFIQPLVYIFSKKRKRGWGVVYNSLTKQPVDLAVVRLFNAKTNQLIATKVSDKEGRYIFVVDLGFYKMTVSKQEFVFPTKFLTGFSEDSRYLNLYHGQEIEVKEKNSVINASIPLDSNKQFKLDHWLIRDHLTFSLKLAVPIAALILSFLSYLLTPNIYFLILFIFNFLLFALVRSIRPRANKDWGIVADKKNKNPLNLAVVRIFDSTFDKLLDQQVTNRRGQYGFLVGGRKFYLTYNKDGYLEKVSQPIDFTKEEKGKIVGFDAYLEQIKKEWPLNKEENKQDFIKKLTQKDLDN